LLLEFKKELIDAVCFLHKKDILHKDLKPENIMISFEEKLKIGDFGISSYGSLKTELDTGTRFYAAPEQRGHGEKILTTKVDVFTVGLILVDLWSSKVLNEQDRMSLQNGNIPADIKCPNFIKFMLTMNPKNRPTMAEVKEKMEN